jgi:hypothetical protein
MSDETRDNGQWVAPGEVALYMKEDATVMVEALALDLVRIWCLGAEDHFDAEGHCEHCADFAWANPDVTATELLNGGPRYQRERAVDLKFRSLIGFDQGPDEIEARRAAHDAGTCKGMPDCGWCIRNEIEKTR